MKKNLSRFFTLVLTAAVLAGAFLPVFASAIDQMEVAATAAVLVDADHGDILLDQSAHARRYPASITKVMTSLLTLEAVDEGKLSLDTVVTAQASAFTGLSADGSTQNIKAGEQLTVQQLLECALIPSANEACNILAEAVAGDVPSFVELMNKKAAELGMNATHFANPNGLHDDDHYTTAYDISLMTIEALKNETFRTIIAISDCRIPATNLSADAHFFNTNALLSNWRYIGYTYSKAIGVKTGSTPEAGECLVSAAVDGGRTLVAVVLGAENVTNADGTLDRQSFSESKRLLQWGFANFSRKTILESTALGRGAGDLVRRSLLRGGASRRHAGGHPAQRPERGGFPAGSASLLRQRGGSGGKRAGAGHRHHDLSGERIRHAQRGGGERRDALRPAL
jgi:D-alanyl-D-alanine carboxypeptidase (penicillin-binding protein 5/6)